MIFLLREHIQESPSSGRIKMANGVLEIGSRDFLNLPGILKLIIWDIYGLHIHRKVFIRSN